MNLEDKAIDIKGKKYVLVSDRVVYFNETYKEGSITTEMVSRPEDDYVVVKATVKPDEKRMFTGYSQATWNDGYINKTSALENAETSAVGRALAFMGIGVIESIASVDEINKAQGSNGTKTTPKELTARQIAEKDIAEEDDIFGLRNIEDAIKKSTKLTDKDKEELAFIANEKALTLGPNLK